MITIATHNGTQAYRGHNIRNPQTTDVQKHIDKNGIHETWADEPPRAAYKRIFGQAVEEYNKAQTRDDRKIKDYFNKIKNDNIRNPVYEMIIGVYGDECTPSVGKDIMRQFVDGWKQRNPNLELIGAYYHADEEGYPHVHIDYIPVAHGYKRGMEIQNSLSKGLEQMGFQKVGKETAQIQWERRENKFLESLCNEHGLTVEHPKKEKQEHIKTDMFKAQKELEQAQADLEQTKEALVTLTGEYLTQEDIKNKTVKKDIFGRPKKTVELEYSEYCHLKNTALSVANIEQEKIELQSNKKIQNDKEMALNEMANNIAGVVSIKMADERKEFKRQLKSAESRASQNYDEIQRVYGFMKKFTLPNGRNLFAIYKDYKNGKNKNHMKSKEYE